MNKLDSKNRVQAIRDYLVAIGAPISSVQGYEVLARALGFKNKHVMSADASHTPNAVAPGEPAFPEKVKVDGDWVQVLHKDALLPCDIVVMEALNWTFDIVMPVPLTLADSEGDSSDDVDALNDYVSEKLTGNSAALESIGYTHVPEINYGEGFVALRVTGHVSSPADLFDAVADPKDVLFYADLQELMELIKPETRVEVLGPDASVEGGIRRVLCIKTVQDENRLLLWTYANEHGVNNDQVNSAGESTVFLATGPGNRQVFTVEDLKYATKTGAKSWHISRGGPTFIRFLD